MDGDEKTLLCEKSCPCLSHAQLSTDMPERDRLAAIYKSGKQVVLDRTRLRAAGESDAIQGRVWGAL